MFSMKTILGLMIIALTVAVTFSQQGCSKCPPNKWAVCQGSTDSSDCTCPLEASENYTIQVKCGETALTSKCFMMKTEMYKTRSGKSTRRKPGEHAIVDNDGIYDPDCESSGIFKAKQCNNSQECWCVNTAGVRRTDKKDKSITCSELVKTWWVRIDLKHEPLKQISDADFFEAVRTKLMKRYGVIPASIANIMREEENVVTVDLYQNTSGNAPDLATVAYYLEKDVKNSSLFTYEKNLNLAVGTTSVPVNDIFIYFVDEKPPEFTMKHLTGGIIAVIVVVVLGVVAAIIVLIIAGKKSQKKRPEGKEMDEMQKQQLTA